MDNPKGYTEGTKGSTEATEEDAVNDCRPPRILETCVSVFRLEIKKSILKGKYTSAITIPAASGAQVASCRLCGLGSVLSV